MTADTNQSAVDELFFKAIIDSYIKNPRFIHRNWLADEVDERLKEPDCRFVFLTAEPGAGKSSFMAQLAHDHPDWARYFIRKDQRDMLMDVGARSLLLRIGYQLAARFPDLFTQEQLTIAVEQRIGTVEDHGEVIGAEVKRILASPFYSMVLQIQQDIKRNKGTVIGLRIEELFIDPRLIDQKDLQYMAIIDPAMALMKHEPTRQIVILVDALDEIRYHGIEGSLLKWMIDCPELPPNIRFVLTSRLPEGQAITFLEKKQALIKPLTIDANDDRIKDELRVYVKNLVSIPEVNKILSAKVKGVDDFLKEAVEKADGNIGYLDAIARGVDHALSVKEKKELEGLSLLKGLLSLKELPKDTQDLYGFILHQIKNSPSVRDRSIRVRDESTGRDHFLSIWTDVYKPMLGILSVAFEALTIDQIHALGGIVGNRDDVIEAKEWLLQFLDEEEGDKYRFYHGTVQEFLTYLETGQVLDSDDLYVDPVRWHHRIAMYYWNKFRDDWNSCDRYGLNSLALHMSRGGDHDYLNALISKQWMTAHLGKEGISPSGFANDVAIAWESELTRPSPALKHFVRLHFASLLAHEKSASYDDDYLTALVYMNRIGEAIDSAQWRSDPEARVNGLFKIARSLADITAKSEPETSENEKYAEQLQSIGEMIYRICQGIDRSTIRIELLSNLGAAYLQANIPEGITLFNEAKDEIRNQDKRGQIHGFMHLAKCLGEVNDPRCSSMFRQAVSIALKTDKSSRNTYMQVLAEKLVSPGIEGEMTWFINTISDSIDSVSDKSYLLTWVAYSLRKISRFDDAEGLLEKISETGYKTDVAIDLVNVLFKTDPKRALRILIDAAKKASNETNSISKAYNFGRLAASAALLDQNELADDWYRQSEEAANDMQMPAFNRSMALSRVVVNLVKGGRYDKAEEIARTIKNRNLLEEMYGSLATQYAEKGRYNDAIKYAFSITHTDFRDQALLRIVNVLVREKEFDLAVKTARNIGNVLGSQLNAYDEIIKGLISDSRPDEAITLAQKLPNGERKPVILSSLAAGFARAGDDHHTNQALDIAEMATFEQQRGDFLWTHEKALRKLSDLLIRLGFVKHAESVARLISGQMNRAEVLIELAGALDSSQSERMNKLYDEVEELLYDTDEPKLNQMLHDLSVIKGSDLIVNNKQRIVSNRAHDLSIHMARTGAYDRAEKMARSIENHENRISALKQIAEIKIASNHKIGIDEGNEFSDDITDVSWLIPAFMKITENPIDSVDPSTTPIDHFLGLLIDLLEPLIQSDPLTCLELIREAAEVSGWVRHDWAIIKRVFDES